MKDIHHKIWVLSIKINPASVNQSYDFILYCGFEHVLEKLFEKKKTITFVEYETNILFKTERIIHMIFALTYI